jgi:hypothetical protein
MAEGAAGENSSSEGRRVAGEDTPRWMGAVFSVVGLLLALAASYLIAGSPFDELVRAPEVLPAQ